MHFTDGGFTEWTIFSPCTAKCVGDQGERVRGRFCQNPEPAFGGENCDSNPINCTKLIIQLPIFLLLRSGI